MKPATQIRVLRAFSMTRPAIPIITAVALYASTLTAAIAEDGKIAAETRIRDAVAGDSCCIVSNVTVHTFGETNITEVFYILKPGPDSFIRCRVAMPGNRHWSGRMWGYGRGGWSGNDSSMVNNAKTGDAAVSCDMGTGASTGWTRKHSPTPWPEDIWKDFGWRSTHLMTVYAKKFCKAFYGRTPDRSYFKGASTGGGQGMHEAQRFPEDYDGIISELACNSRISQEASAFHRMILSKRLEKLDKKRIQILADAPVEFMAGRDASSVIGGFLVDPRMCDQYAEEILDLAAQKDPVFSEPDLRAALMELFAGPVHKGRRVHPGYCWGARFSHSSGFLFKNHYEKKHGRKPGKSTVTWDDFDDFVAARKEIVNATDPDLSAFAARGGKIIQTAGLEDQTIPFAPAIDHYEEAAEVAGGMEKLKKFFRLFMIPGCAHGSAGREFISCPVPDIKQVLVDWVEKGIAPEHLRPVSRTGKTMDVPAYPALAGDSSNGKPTGGGIRKMHPFYR